jgi:hypothetical protein
MKIVLTEGTGAKKGVCNEGSGGCGSDCAAESELHVTATLLRCTISTVVKSLFEKCLLHNNLLRSILAESVVQDIPTLLAHA